IIVGPAARVEHEAAGLLGGRELDALGGGLARGPGVNGITLADLDWHTAVTLALDGHHGAPAPVRQPVPPDSPHPIIPERRPVQPLAEQPFEILLRFFI